MSVPDPEIDSDVLANWFLNHYECSVCGEYWTDEWSCMCNDKCPMCNAEIEPYESEDLSVPLTKEDYVGAARIVTGNPDATGTEVTDDEAREYAEAWLEGGEHRFMPSRKP